MIGMSETSKPEEREVTDVVTTSQEWRGFLERYGELYVHAYSDGDELVDLLEEEELEAFDRGERVKPWLGEAPAREEALAAAEERLGVRFPPSVRGFFLASDGWTPLAASWVGGVRPCDRVVWMRDSEAGRSVTEIYDSIPGNEEEVHLFRRSVEIAHGEDFWLLDPTDVGPEGEWAAYKFAPKYGNPSRYPNFYALFRSSYNYMKG
ncbi:MULTISPECIES: SMI1/KNR4 family protein [Streptomyces]|uniref:SMI1/KNR4 family protein n=1 Tax=Streptomyces glycanivorans TaxID=3033808 RepID=A0ABY9JLP9_9ACTN|nr:MULTISPECIES: SMI1/KNR4 family protein [unclassified Streptomyces]WLQ68670.1 SMI1/KNR4 family protein [Streptomyces sp. Alt3]WSQ89354.1 SMI1/KNR4 family protein [Streptomyces sp. NBC_01212]WSR04638.1 SMI1/KNR4 family protein [Streptomyces sp. NBC_01208]WSR52746.1 SMI1/KNR4 family protein [Streptomyces sp. NBC_01201]